MLKVLKVKVNVYSRGELAEKNVFLNPSEISEIVPPSARPDFRSYVGDGDNKTIGAVIIMRNGNAYRVIDNIDNIMKALEE